MTHTRIGAATRGLLAAAAVAFLAFGAAPSPAEAGGIRNCVDVTGSQFGRVGCYENVWSGGVQYRMTFSNQAFPGATPGELDRFYVVAPQTASPQGPMAGFPHDHVVRDVPAGTGRYSVKLAGHFVLCTEQGLLTGTCAPMWLAFGGPAMPFAQTVDGQPLTSTAAIESAASDGDVALVDLGPSAVIVGTINPN